MNPVRMFDDNMVKSTLNFLAYLLLVNMLLLRIRFWTKYQGLYMHYNPWNYGVDNIGVL